MKTTYRVKVMIPGVKEEQYFIFHDIVELKQFVKEILRLEPNALLEII